MCIKSGRAFVIAIIKKYKNSPCLWQVTHRDYRNKTKRKEALNELVELFKTKDENANLDTVKKRISSMRNCFNKELNKVKQSIKSDSSDRHIPKLWYYNYMYFLADVKTPKRSSSARSSVDDLPFDGDAEISNDDNQSIKQSPRSIEIPSPISSAGSIPQTKRRKTEIIEIQVDPLQSNERNSPPSPQKKLKYAAYGEHVAERLRSMPALMATYCQKIMNDAIFMAETNNLDISSHVAGIRQAPSAINNDWSNH